MAEKDDHFKKDEKKHDSDNDSTYDDDVPAGVKGASGKPVKDEAFYEAKIMKNGEPYY